MGSNKSISNKMRILMFWHSLGLGFIVLALSRKGLIAIPQTVTKAVLDSSFVTLGPFGT